MLILGFLFNTFLIYTLCDDTAAKVVGVVTNIIDTTSKIGGAITHIKDVRDSFDTSRQIPYEKSVNDNPVGILKQLSSCDPGVKGFCCVTPAMCSPNAECYANKLDLSVAGAVKAVPYCKCKPGFKGDGYSSGSGCQNIDECFEGTHSCEQICRDESPGYSCGCNTGYRLKADGLTCEDVDECAEDPTLCEFGCKNKKGSYECVCPPGLVHPKDDERACMDIDECALMKEIHLHQKEIQKGKSISELSTLAGLAVGTLKMCEYPQLCKNTIGGYTCPCPFGYRVDPNDPTKCIDIDECEEGFPEDYFSKFTSKAPIERFPVCKNKKDDSITSKRCINTVGGFRCECGPGYNVIQFIPSEDLTAYLNYSVDESKDPYLLNLIVQQLVICKDVNECLEPGICTENHIVMPPVEVQFLKNRAPRLNYMDMPTLDEETFTETYQNIYSEYKEQIASLKESQAGTPVEFFKYYDRKGAMCFNTMGSFSCMCPNQEQDFDYMTGRCQEYNACERKHSCRTEMNEICETAGNSYKCACAPGFRNPDKFFYLPGDSEYKEKRFCYDINECADNMHECQYGCINLHGSYRCECGPGYEYDKLRERCVNIDECKYTPCGGNMMCIDLPGTFICQCPRFYSSEKYREDPISREWLTESAIEQIDSIYEYQQYIGSQEINWKDPHWTSIYYHLQTELMKGAVCRKIDTCRMLERVDPGLGCPNNLICRTRTTCECADGFDMEENVPAPGHQYNYRPFNKTYERQPWPSSVEYQIEYPGGYHPIYNDTNDLLDIDQVIRKQPQPYTTSESLKAILGVEEFNKIQRLFPKYKIDDFPPAFFVQLEIVDFYEHVQSHQSSYCEDVDECKENPCGKFQCCENKYGYFQCRFGLFGKCIF